MRRLAIGRAPPTPEQEAAVPLKPRRRLPAAVRVMIEEAMEGYEEEEGEEGQRPGTEAFEDAMLRGGSTGGPL